MINETIVSTNRSAPFDFILDTNHPAFVEDIDSAVKKGVLKILAIGSEGSSDISDEVTIFINITAPSSPVVRIMSPEAGSISLEPGPVEVNANILASPRQREDVSLELMLDGQSAGKVSKKRDTFDPFAWTLKELNEGEHELSIKYLGINGDFCRCPPVRFRVAKLGLQSPRSTEQVFQAKGLSVFPDVETSIQVSSDLREWENLIEFVPGTNCFVIDDPAISMFSNRFYRIIIVPDP